jgi:hypothetical protein
MPSRDAAAAAALLLLLAAAPTRAGEPPLAQGFDKVRWTDTRQGVLAKYKKVLTYGGDTEPDGSISTSCIFPAQGKMCVMASFKFDGAKPGSHLTQVVLLVIPAPPEPMGTDEGLEAAWRTIQGKLGLPPGERPRKETKGVKVGGVTVDVLGDEGDFGAVIYRPAANAKR